MGLEPTTERVRFFRAWAACEGGRASYNPLNTTYPAMGATEYNSVGVRNYADELQGVACTLATIRLSYYSRLRKALATNGLSAEQILHRGAGDVATWGTDPACIRRVLAAKKK